MIRLFELINRNLSFSKLGDIVKKDKTSDKTPLITISRQKGSGGVIIAQKVAKKLGKSWKSYHKELIDGIAKEAHLEKELIRAIDEKKLSLVDEMIGDFFGKRYANMGSYYKNLVKILSTIAQRGRAVIVGRGAAFIFPESLKIRIVADLEDRISAIAKRENVSKKTAGKIIEEAEKQRREFSETLFRHDTSKDHSHYDLAIKVGKNLSIEQAADLIVHLARKRFKI